MAPDLSKTVVILQLEQKVHELEQREERAAKREKLRLNEWNKLNKILAHLAHKLEKKEGIDSLCKEYFKDRIDQYQEKSHQKLAEMIFEIKLHLSGQKTPVAPNSPSPHCASPSIRSARLRTPQNTPTRTEKCPVEGCKTTCKSKQTLQHHIQRLHAHRSPLQNKHDDDEEEDDSFRSHKCSVCDSGFDNEEEKNAHEIQKHFPNKKYQAHPCSVCDEEITNKEEENEHRQDHFPVCPHPKVQYDKCCICGATDIAFKNDENIISSTRIEFSNFKL